MFSCREKVKDRRKAPLFPPEVSAFILEFVFEVTTVIKPIVSIHTGIQCQVGVTYYRCYMELCT